MLQPTPHQWLAGRQTTSAETPGKSTLIRVAPPANDNLPGWISGYRRLALLIFAAVVLSLIGFFVN